MYACVLVCVCSLFSAGAASVSGVPIRYQQPDSESSYTSNASAGSVSGPASAHAFREQLLAAAARPPSFQAAGPSAQAGQAAMQLQYQY